MGLYLCVFEGDEELEGVEMGSYDDFGFFRRVVEEQLEGGTKGSRFPVLMLHSDSDGQWGLEDVTLLAQEIREIASELAKLPSIDPPGDWQRDVMRQLGLRPSTLGDCFIDVDGEPLLQRLAGLCAVALRNRQPILFQ